MLLEQTQVSRKTPLDGKVEISADTAARLATLGKPLAVVARGETAGARVETLTCTCAKRSGEPHVHHFVESPILKALAAGSEVRLELEPDTATLRIEPVSELR